MTSAPRIKGGAVSAAKTGTVADLGPVRVRAASSVVENASQVTRNQERTDSESENETRSEKIPPTVRAAGPDARKSRDRGGDEDSAATTEEVVERRREPAT